MNGEIIARHFAPRPGARPAAPANSRVTTTHHSSHQTPHTARMARPRGLPRSAPTTQPECTFSPPRLALRSTPFSNSESAAHASPKADGTDCWRYHETTASYRPTATSRAAERSVVDGEDAHDAAAALRSSEPVQTARNRSHQVSLCSASAAERLG